MMRFLSTEWKKTLVTLAMLGSLGFTTACSDYTSNRAANNKSEAYAEEADPLEGFNRVMFALNTGLDTVIVRPVSYVYRAVVPEFGRNSVSNVLTNLNTPIVFANSVLQGDVQNSFATLWRFVINTTVGIGGINDVAGTAGLKNRSTGFGDTLASYGVNSGSYLYLPLMGPTTVRDGFGRGVDMAFDPMTYVNGEWEWLPYAKAGANVVDFRAANMKLIDDVYANSVDPYATFRSGYLQHRTEQVRRLNAPARK